MNGINIITYEKKEKMIEPATIEQEDINALWADNLKTVVMECSAPPKMTGIVRNDDWRYRDMELFVPCDSVTLI